MQQAGRDRYSSLLRTLQAGQELPWQQRPKTAGRFVWHPVAGKLLRLVLLGILLYAALTVVLGLWRDQRLETWVGPDASVMSGQRLADCPLVGSVRDDTFPNWIRFGGTIYRLTEAVRPMGFEPDAAFPPTGHRLGSMTLFRTIGTPEGQAGAIVLVKLDNAPVGRVYRATPDCS